MQRNGRPPLQDPPRVDSQDDMLFNDNASIRSHSSEASLADSHVEDQTLSFLRPAMSQRDVLDQSYKSSRFGSNSLNSWVSSYRRSAAFLGETIDPTLKPLEQKEEEADLDVEAGSTLFSSFEEVSSVVLEHEPLLAQQTWETEYGTSGDVKVDTSAHDVHHGSQPMSTFSQTTFNAVNVLMGIGILSLPFAFRITGWIVGGVLLALCCGLTRHTAGLLAQCLDYIPVVIPAPSTDHEPASSRRPSIVSVRGSLTAFPKITRRAATYGDIGELAFGWRGRTIISLVFVLELSAACVALVILISDSVTALFPTWPHWIVKFTTVLFLIPLTWPASLRWASYGSLLGVVALLNLLVIITYDGLTTRETPGSLLVPAETHLWPEDWSQVPFAIGLVMAGFCGHSVFPNIYRDMQNPTDYKRMLNVSYVITTSVYIFLAACGYAMFGNYTMPEITQNLPQVDSYSRTLTHWTLWLTAVNPLTKFPLNVNPINTQIEHSLHQLFSLPYPLPLPYRSLFRTITALAILATAIVFPEFHSIMSLMGSGFAFTVCVVFPGCCFLKLYGQKLGFARWGFEMSVVGVGIVLGALGTVWALFV